MNSYGLGLVLNFVDNASSGMQRATNTFQQMNGMANSLANGATSASSSVSALTFAGYSLSTLGQNLAQVGGTVTGIFKNISAGVNAVGSTIYSARVQLSALYGSQEGGETMLNKIQEYAKTSVFAFESLIPAVVSLKSVGIEAFDAISTSSGSATQTLLDYASDLASFNPNMRNAYGVGINAAIGALKEYIAEGNAMSLKRGAGLDITGILGEDKGATVEARTQQIADLIEHTNMLGITASQMGTPTNMISNLGDVWFQFKQKISDNGVYGKYIDFLKKIFDYVTAIPADEIENIALVISEGLISLASPLEKALELGTKAADWLRDTIKTNPMLVQTIMKVSAFAGALLLGAGYALKFGGGMMFALAGISAVAGKSGSIITDVTNVGKVFSSLGLTILPLVALASLFYVAWTENIGGFKDNITGAFKDILSYAPVIADGLDGSMSETNFDKAKELGLLPFIEGIQQLKYHWDFFVEGFKLGVENMLKGLDDTLAKFGLVDTDVKGLIDNITLFMEKLTQPGSEENWRKVGEAFAYIAAALVVIVPLVKIFSFVGSVVTTIFNVGVKIKNAFLLISGGASTAYSVIGEVFMFMKGLPVVLSPASAFIVKILTGISAFFGYIGSALSAAGSAIMSVLSVIASALGLPVAAVIAIIVAIVALIVVIIVFRKEIWAAIQAIGIGLQTLATSIYNKLTSIFMGIYTMIKDTPVGRFIISVINMFKSMQENAQRVMRSIVDFIMTNFNKAQEFMRTVVSGILNVYNSVQSFIRNLINTIVKVFTSINNFIQSVINYVVAVIKSKFMEAFNYVYENFIKPLTDAFWTGFNWIMSTVITPMVEFAQTKFNEMLDVVTPIIDDISAWFKTSADNICGFIEDIKVAFVGIWDGITATASTFFDWVGEKLGAFSELISGIGNFIVGNVDAATTSINAETAKVESNTVGLSTGGYVKNEGMAMLHPDEVVVNDDLTRGLGNFLNDYTSGTSNVMSRIASRSSSNGGSSTNDNSVTFMSGSVLIQLANASDAELERAASVIMDKISRKTELKKMAVRS